MIEITKAVYHEAAHVIYAYMIGYTCDTIQIDEKGNGFSKLDCGNDTNFVRIFKQYYGNSSALMDWVNNLSIDMKAHASIIAEKFCSILISGAVAECIIECNPDVYVNLNIEIGGPDLVYTEILSECFQLNLNKLIYDVLRGLRAPQIWSAVKMLVDVITESSERTITKEVIEATLKHSGFFKLIRENS
jgi:hypothetical protein